jgi:hypothetical protein
MLRSAPPRGSASPVHRARIAHANAERILRLHETPAA